MASTLVVKVACMAMVCMVLATIPLAHGALPCGQVQYSVASCFGYLRGSGGPIPRACCNGIKTLNSEAKTTPDRQGVCTCLKSVVSRFPGLNPAKLAALPADCGVNLPYKVSPSIDCSTVK
ncbi:hypothetical protein RJT34_17755 [Clitoria ternatea]|uniref:Non-specific lipid-transfer protein n=1 Tax=Clitoria ternatea TaxID=43366 RepID=A0AAN9PDK7_CLITE